MSKELSAKLQGENIDQELVMSHSKQLQIHHLSDSLKERIGYEINAFCSNIDVMINCGNCTQNDRKQPAVPRCVIRSEKEDFPSVCIDRAPEACDADMNSDFNPDGCSTPQSTQHHPDVEIEAYNGELNRSALELCNRMIEKGFI